MSGEVKLRTLALPMVCSIVPISIGIAFVPDLFNFWAMSALGGQRDFGAFVLGGLLLALAAGFGAALICTLRVRTRRGS